MSRGVASDQHLLKIRTSVLGVGRGTISREKAQNVDSKSDLTLHLLVCVLRKVAGWIALAKLIIEHIGFV